VINNYLIKKFGKKRSKDLRQSLWPPISKRPEKEPILHEIIEEQLSEHFPNGIDNIDSMHQLSEKVGVSYWTIRRWLKEYLIQRDGQYTGNMIYTDIWSSRDGKNRKVAYANIKEDLENAGGRLITTGKEWNEMKPIPTDRRISVQCENLHNPWNIRVAELIYRGRWCPHCNRRLSEKVMGLYMDEVFGVPFSPVTLSEALGIPGNEGGRLRFDGYNGRVKVGDKWFKIAFEYDGIQHDNFPNSVHRTQAEFFEQQERDERKNQLAQENDVIIIRLKAINGFDRNSLDSFQVHIISQFNSNELVRRGNVKLPPMRLSRYDPLSKSLKPRKGSMDNFLDATRFMDDI
jgi:hypothetical protein